MANQKASKRVILESSDDWLDWYDDVKRFATPLYIWNYIDPSLPDPPAVVTPAIVSATA